jgi:uncharacterized membrane protein YuzA (DUF378 family)
MWRDIGNIISMLISVGFLIGGIITTLYGLFTSNVNWAIFGIAGTEMSWAVAKLWGLFSMQQLKID